MTIEPNGSSARKKTTREWHGLVFGGARAERAYSLGEANLLDSPTGEWLLGQAKFDPLLALFIGEKKKERENKLILLNT